ncbi:MAG: glycoside hydrolase family 95 protein, partial [Acidimicrobiia bacterium]
MGNRLVRVIALLLVTMILFVSLRTRGAMLSDRAQDPSATAPADNRMMLWYRRAAPQWDHALPVGNGRIGGMVFGNVRRERIQLNEDSLWMGFRRETDNPDALTNLPEARRLLFAGLPVEAYTLAEQKLMGRPSRLESYQTLGDLRLSFDQEGTVTDYRLELDLDTAIARLTYRIGEVGYTREVFVSRPDQVLVVRVTADKPRQVSFSTWIDRVQDAKTEVVASDRLDLVGRLACEKGLSFQASVKIVKEGGTFATFPERILLDEADAATLLLSAATSYHGEEPRAIANRQMTQAAAKPYDQLRAAHVADHRALFRRAGLHLQLNGTQPDLAFLPTDERLERVKRGEVDTELDALYFQFGRYLLIASSRPGDLPANLQGVWNESMNPPWDSDYHLNINLQMNYWPAEVTN